MITFRYILYNSIKKNELNFEFCAALNENACI